MFTLLSEDELSERLRCSLAALRRFRNAGGIAFLPGRTILYTEEDVALVFGAHPLLSAAQAAERLNVTVERLEFLRQRGKLSSLQLDDTCFRVEDVEAFLLRWGDAEACERAIWDEAREIAARRKAERDARRVSHSVKRLKLAASGFYYVHWTEGRRSKRVSTGTKDPRKAERFLRDFI